MPDERVAERDAIIDYLLGELWQAHERIMDVYEGSEDMDDLVAWVQGRQEDWVEARRSVN